MESIEHYLEEMKKHLPETEDDKLFNYHTRTVKGLKEAIGEAFMDIIDLNWTKCEEACREILGQLKKKLLGPLWAKNDVRRDDYWSLMVMLCGDYKAGINESSNTKMLFIRLEYLDDRQDADFNVLIDEMLKQAIEDGASAAVGNGVMSGTIEENSKKELKLRMTCGRIVVFCNYWIKCRQETIAIFNKILDIFKSRVHRAKIFCLLACICLSDETNPVQMYLEWLVSQDGFNDILIQFAHTVNKDFFCYKILLRKLTEFLDLVKSSEYLKAFDVEAKDLFFNVSTCQTNLSNRQSDTCSMFEICENIIRQQQERLGATTKLLACTSRPLLHLKDLLRNLHDDDSLNQAGIEGVIKGLQQENTDFSTIFSKSLQSFLRLSEKVNKAVEQMKKNIKEWIPRREQSIAEMKEIIQKLNKTTKDIAITQTVSSSVGIVGGAITVGCIIAAPFTFGTSLLVGGIVSGVGAATAIGAKIAEIVIDKGDMENAIACIEEDKVSFEKVTECIRNLNKKSSMLLGYIPLDELASLISAMTDRQITPMVQNFSKPEADTLVVISRVVVAGVVFASKAGVLSVLRPLFILGAIFDIVSLVQAAWKLGQGAKSEYAEKLEGVVKRMEAEKRIIEDCLASLEG